MWMALVGRDGEIFPLVGIVCEYGEGCDEGERIEGREENQTLIWFVSYNIRNFWNIGLESDIREV